MSTKPRRPRKRPSLGFLASLPERTFRVSAATLGGATYHLAEVLLPGWLRDSKFYQATVGRTLRITVEMVGGVSGVMPPEEMPVNTLLVRKTVGNVIELAGVLAIGWSPLWLLAAVSDISGGTKVYLHTLADELQQRGLLTNGTPVISFEDLLGRLEQSSGILADTIDIPPLSLREIRATWESLRTDTRSIPSLEELDATYANLRETSARSAQSLLIVSSVVAASAVRVSMQLGARHVLRHYQEALGAILREGLSAYLGRISAPYLSITRVHLDPNTPSYTERALRQMGRWHTKFKERRPAAKQVNDG